MFSFWRTIILFLLVAGLCTILNPIISENIDAYYFSILMYTGINIIAAVSLNLVNGITGQFSMGHAGFMAVGAYVGAVCSTKIFPLVELTFLPKEVVDFGLFFLALMASGIVAAILGFFVGLPSLRLRGDYLAIVTLGFGEIIRVVFLNIDYVGGARGLPGIPKLSTFAWVYFIVFFCVFMIYRIMHSRFGRALLAVREDEIAAEAAGVNTTRSKVLAFVIGAFFAGISGNLFGHFLTYLNPQTFDFNRSFEIITMVVLGGMGSISGAVLAAIFLTGLREVLRPLQEFTGQDYRMVIYSLLLVILMLTRPNGFLGAKEIYQLSWIAKIWKQIRSYFAHKERYE